MIKKFSFKNAKWLSIDAEFDADFKPLRKLQKSSCGKN